MLFKMLKISCSLLLCLLMLGVTRATELYVGRASVDVTPKLPVAVDGQFEMRLATKVDNPITANIIVLSAGARKNEKETSIIVSCDLVAIPDVLLNGVREIVGAKIKGLDKGKIMINATHTHTAPVTREGIYLIPEEATQPGEFLRFLIDKIAGAIMEAWNNQQKASVSWGLDYAKVAYNRRASYQDGKSQMYGNTSAATFRKLEAGEDESINTLFFWNTKGELLAVSVNVSCPAQIVESRSTVNADYWHFVRQNLKKRFGKELCVVGWIGAAGDQAPRPMYNHLAEYRMVKLREQGGSANFESSDVNFQTEVYLQDIANRISDAVIRSYEAVKGDKHTDLIVKHVAEKVALPMRLVTAQEYEMIKKEQEEAAASKELTIKMHRRTMWNNEVLARFEKQKTDPQPMHTVEVQVLRIGDVVICSNPFELFTDYGIQIKAKSKALQTFVVQLAGEGSYLPTEEAMKGGHYSAIVQSNLVGPQGGQVLVDSTVGFINGMWQ